MVENLELKSLPKLKSLLDEKLGKSVWFNYEPETILMELGELATPLLMDKICLLILIETTPSLVYSNPALFLYASCVMSNEPADFDTVPNVNLLQAAYSIRTINALLIVYGITPEYPEALVKTCSYILREEGCSEPLSPFKFVPKSELVEGQTPKDISDKEKAVNMYFIHMDSL